MNTKNPFIRFLLFLSKTDEDILQNCSKSSVNNQVTFGAFVLLTGILAFISGTYAISNMFMEYNAATKDPEISNTGVFISMLLGLIYAIMIISIDREIVSANNKKKAILRIPLAIIIGIVVAVPIELKLMEGRIEKQLFKNSQSENAQFIFAKEDGINELQARRKAIEQTIAHERQQISYWSDAMEAETTGRVKSGRTGIPGQGHAYREAEKNLKLHQGFLQDAQNELQAHLNSMDKKIVNYNNDYNARHIDQRYDLLSKYETLVQLKSNDHTGAIRNMAGGIMFLFILLELIPALMKLMATQDEYNGLLAARTKLNIQTINAIANKGLDDMARDAKNASNNRRYFGDISNNINK
jgi:hypothetical protein